MSQNIFFLDHGFPNQNHPNLEFQLEDLHKSIRPDLLKSLQKSKQTDKIKHVFDIETFTKMEQDIKNFVLECKKRRKSNILPTIHQVCTFYCSDLELELNIIYCICKDVMIFLLHEIFIVFKENIKERWVGGI